MTSFSMNHGRRQLQDIVTCIRTRTTIDEVGFERERHADRYLKPPEEMERLFPRYREALARTVEIVARAKFSLEELRRRRSCRARTPRPRSSTMFGNAFPIVIQKACHQTFCRRLINKQLDPRDFVSHRLIGSCQGQTLKR